MLWNLIFSDSETTLGLQFDSFFVTEDSHLCFFLSELVSGRLLLPICVSKYGRPGVSKPGFGKEGVAKTILSQKSFN